MLAEALNFIAFPLVIAVVQAVLFWVILKRAGFARWTAFLSFVPVLGLIGIYFGGGWMSFHAVLGPIPLAIPLYQMVMFAVSIVPLFILAVSRWPTHGDG